MKNYKVKFNFYGFEITINTDSEELVNLLKIDFRYFLKEDIVKKQLILNAVVSDKLTDIIPRELVANKQSINSMTFDQGHIRYNDYYGEAVSLFDYKNEKCDIYAKTINRLHEITYLIMLSRQGKWCDRNGLHKIHAMAISKNNTNMVLMLPMKGGKTTLFTRFLTHEEVGLISDDSPMVDLSGNLKAFPIRFGLEDREMYKNIVDGIDSKYKSRLERKQFGPKVLIDLTAYGDRIGKMGKKTILIQGKRHNSKKTIIKKINIFHMYMYLVTNLVVGIGLPMIIEYFLESSLKDKITNLKILCSRTLSALSLAIKSENYLVLLGTDIENNALEIKKLFQ
tara:strand:+ start:216 stop:1232 length:1017 start_codon:yes stop_codon:yes gene_type:complete